MPENKPLIEVNLGSPVSISAEIKTEIPKESTGRLLDALTDAIRPFTESRGLRADQIRLQRAEVAIEIAYRAQKLLQIEGGNAQPVGPKFLIPFLEKASLEDPESDFVDRWASLLASAVESPGDDLSVCTSILSELGPTEAALLDRSRVQLSNNNLWPGADLKKIAEKWIENAKAGYSNLQEVMADYAEGKISVEDVLSHLTGFSATSPCVVTTFHFGRPGQESKTLSLPFSNKESVAVDVLVYRNLLKVESYWEVIDIISTNRKPHRGTLHVEYFALTNLGLLFLRRVSPRPLSDDSKPPA
jgi:hypothetical protein